MNTRCVNLDWLEVHALEPIDTPHDRSYFESCGFHVEERAYGTRVYEQMFTLYGNDGEPMYEVRRLPKSTGLHGIHSINECHLRLCNRTCYSETATYDFWQFLQLHNYQIRRISRADICMDFVTFDRGDDPAVFLTRYLKGRFAKINQANIRAHGTDSWTGQQWNSIAWGSPASAVGTKMYCKTMELYDIKNHCFRKPYILQAWHAAGLIDDEFNCALNGQRVNVWRVEFSLKSEQRNWVTIEVNGRPKAKHSMRNTLEAYMGRDRLLILFASLAQHYFHFKHYEVGVRKDRCKDKVLFEWAEVEHFYKLADDGVLVKDNKTRAARLMKLIVDLEAIRNSRSDHEVRKACDTLVSMLKNDVAWDMAPLHVDYERLAWLRSVLCYRTSVPGASVNMAMKEVASLLNIHRRILDLEQNSTQKAVQ